jgi:hypothetical protein
VRGRAPARGRPPAPEGGPQRIKIIHLRTVHIGPESLLVAAKIAVREEDSAAQVAAAIDAAETRARAAVPVALTIYLEPDIFRPDMADRTDPSIRAVLRSRPLRRDRPRKPRGPTTP